MSGHRVVHMPPIHFYTATKHAVTALTEGLRQELYDIKSHIRVTVIDLIECEKVWCLWYRSSVSLSYIFFLINSQMRMILCKGMFHMSANSRQYTAMPEVEVKWYVIEILLVSVS